MKKKKIYNVPRFQNIKEVLSNAVKLYPNNNAFILKNKTENNETYTHITFRKFQEEINNLGTSLLNLGLKGKRVAIISPNRYEWCVSYYAVLNGVGIAVPLDKGLQKNEIESLLKRSYADCVIFDAEYISVMNEIKMNKSTSIKHYICMDDTKEDFLDYSDLIEEGEKLICSGDSSYIRAEIDSDMMSIILFTSGTTAISKAVMLSHRNIAENIYALNSIVKIYDTDISLAFLPFHHTFASTGFLFFASNGAATAFCDGLRHIPQNLKEYKITIFVSVPLLLETMYKKINQEIEKLGKTKTMEKGKIITKSLLKVGIDIRRKVFKQIIDNLGGSLRLAVSGAAAIDPEVSIGFNDFGIRVIQGYGLTETSPVLAAENDKYIKPGSVGIPLPNIDIMISDPDANGIGEIAAKGPSVMLGYYENEEATQEVIKDGWFYTGDLGYQDKEGFVFITGRKKNVIILKNGKNIYPEEMELNINNLPYVSESMVFGYPKGDDLIVSAKIQYNKEYVETTCPGIALDELKNKIWEDIKEINKEMPIYKHIKKIIITEEPMTKTTTQKIKRYEEIQKILKENKS